MAIPFIPKSPMAAPMMSPPANPSNKAATAPRDTMPGTQPRSKRGPPMPPHPTLQPPAGNKPHHLASTMAKGKVRKGKHVIPPAKFSGRAKPQTEY